MTEAHPDLEDRHPYLTPHSIERLDALQAAAPFVTSKGFARTDAASYTDLTLLAEWLLHSAEHVRDPLATDESDEPYRPTIRTGTPVNLSDGRIGIVDEGSITSGPGGSWSTIGHITESGDDDA